MCSTCRRYLAEIASAEQRGDTRTAEVKRKLYEAYRRNVCGWKRLAIIAILALFILGAFVWAQVAQTWAQPVYTPQTNVVRF